MEFNGDAGYCLLKIANIQFFPTTFIVIWLWILDNFSLLELQLNCMIYGATVVK